MLPAIAWLFNTIVDIVFWAVIINAILSWLFAFNVINAGNQFVGAVSRVLNAITEPLLRPFRKFIPPIGGVDLSPLVLLLALQFVRILVNEQLRALMYT